MMDEEERDDTQMRDHFKERWSRTPSRKLTEQLRAEGEKYRGIIDNAVKADSIVKEKYNLNRRAFDILCKSEVRNNYIKNCILNFYRQTNVSFCCRAFMFSSLGSLEIE